MSLASRMKRARLEAGLSQRKLANIVKGTEASIIRYEAGQARPRPARLKAIAEATGKSVSYFLEDDFEVPTEERRYRYSGTYPPERGELGYVADAQGEYYSRLEGKLVFIIERLDRLVSLMEESARTPGKETVPGVKKARRGRPKKHAK
ncbi:MAG: helix-turn-helix domain-containing protein [Chloroflexi bacterium]|nr:helix-turn-helix domain-containing protein [Chloroflexota bacterium]